MASTGEPFGLFWDSEDGDRTYSAGSFESWLKKFFTSGVFNGDLQVKATSGMTLEITPGYANVDGKVKFWNAAFNLTLNAAHSTYPRIDTIVITRDNVNREIRCEVVTGNYSADTPQPTAPIRNAEKYQLVLAQIYVATGATGIIQSNITDTRPNNALCGWITGTVNQLDFSQFTAQFESYFSQFKLTRESDYANWFNRVQNEQIADKAAWDAWYTALKAELHDLPSNSAEFLQTEIDELKESGLSGSIFNISTINPSLQGKIITVTNSDGTETRTGTFDSNLKCTIQGIKSVGQLVITSTDGIQTATRFVNVPYYGNYTFPIAFWAANVNIQGDDNLKGVTVTIKDSDNLTVNTVTLSSSDASGAFTATKADTYSFIYSYDGNDYVVQLAITQETTYSLHLSTISDGETVTPVNDVQTWLHCAGIWNKNYTTIAQVLADGTTFNALVQSDNAVNYMVRSTAWATAVVADSRAMTYIGANSNCTNKLLANSTWRNAICNSVYFENVLTVKVPAMTSDTTPSGECISSGYTGTYYAFDGNDDTHASIQSYSGGFPSDIGYKFTSLVSIKKVYVKSYDYGARSDITNGTSAYTIQASNDGTNWTDLGTSSLTGGQDDTVVLSNNTNNFRYYRLHFESTTTIWHSGQAFGNVYYNNPVTIQFWGR